MSVVMRMLRWMSDGIFIDRIENENNSGRRMALAFGIHDLH